MRELVASVAVFDLLGHVYALYSGLCYVLHEIKAGVCMHESCG